MARIAQPDGSGAITADAKVVPEKIEPGQDGKWQTSGKVVVQVKRGGAHGYAKGQTAGQARRAAISECSDSRCTVVRQYAPGQCAHIVVGIAQIFWNDTVFSAREKGNVLAYCQSHDQSCRVISSECLPK